MATHYVQKILKTGQSVEYLNRMQGSSSDEDKDSNNREGLK